MGNTVLISVNENLIQVKLELPRESVCEPDFLAIYSVAKDLRMSVDLCGTGMWIV